MNPADLAALMPFATLLGIELELAAKDPTIGRLPYGPSLTTAGGALHGGALMALAEYYQKGIPESPVHVDLGQARQLYFQAASAFGGRPWRGASANAIIPPTR